MGNKKAKQDWKAEASRRETERLISKRRPATVPVEYQACGQLLLLLAEVRPFGPSRAFEIRALGRELAVFTAGGVSSDPGFVEGHDRLPIPEPEIHRLLEGIPDTPLALVPAIAAVAHADATVLTAETVCEGARCNVSWIDGSPPPQWVEFVRCLLGVKATLSNYLK